MRNLPFEELPLARSARDRCLPRGKTGVLQDHVGCNERCDLIGRANLGGYFDRMLAKGRGQPPAMWALPVKALRGADERVTFVARFDHL